MITKNKKIGGWDIVYYNNTGGVCYGWTSGTKRDAENELKQIIKENNE